MAKSKSNGKAPTAWRSRIVGEGEEAPDQLLANPWQWKIHPRAQQDALDGVLSEVGWVQRVIVNRQTQHLVDGHARVALAIRRGEKSVPVVYVDLTEAEEKLVLASIDPLSALATADAQKLDELLQDVQSGDAAVQAMLAELAKANGLDYGKPAAEDPGAQIDKAAELQVKWATVTGQLWVIPSKSMPGKAHRLLCGDSTKAEDVARLMGGEKAQVLLTDPPYGMDLDTDWSDAVGQLTSMSRQHQTRGKSYDRVVGDAEPYDPSPLFQQFGYCPEMFLWGADYYAERIPGRADGSWLVWDKRKDSQSDAIGSEFELCWSKAKHKRRVLRHDWFGFLSSENGAEARKRLHPTQKPSSLMRDILEQWANAECLVVDPYGGSGVVTIAAEQTKHPAYSCEIEPKYVAVALERLQGLGLTPELVQG